MGSAIADRPNRFDLVLEIPCPNKEIRECFFSSYIAEKSLVEKIVEITDTLPMAHCVEIIERTKIEEILSNKIFNENIINVATNIKEYHLFYQQEEGKAPNRRTLLRGKNNNAAVPVDINELFGLSTKDD